MAYPQTNLTSRPLLDRNAVQSRFNTFVGGPYADSNLSSVLYHDRRDAHDIEVHMWSAPGQSKPTFAEAKSKLKNAERVSKGVKFGPSWTNHWLKVNMVFPRNWGKTVELHFDPSCEAMIYNENGEALQGITGGFDYNRKIEYLIPSEDVAKGHCTRYIEVTANGIFGMQPKPYWKKDAYYTLETLEIVSVNDEARQLMYDFDTLTQLVDRFPDRSPLANRARSAANSIMDTFDGTSESLPKCRALAQEVWQADEVEGGTLWGIGYCHIDTAWLWPWSATQQKIARSWSSQLDLMDRYPEYRFMATAAQHFAWLEELYPDLFKRVQEKVKSGQFEVNGACWVEMDGNLPSGESFCRQFLYGQKYFASRFGKRSDILVLPDSFGFSPQLPQLARLSGCDSFFTHKMNWNRIDTFPLTNYNWVGLDGSQVLSHLTPISRYDSICTIEEITRGYENHKNLDVSPDAVLAFGHGDGGGGPKPLMLERLRRARAVGLASGGATAEMPLVRQGATLSDFYDHLRRTTNNGKKLPVWNGEMYLEVHRGVQTSQANTKRNFRKSEFLMREVELLSTLASLKGYAYPKERIDKNWQDLCLCMFHDTLPGSSIRLAVEDYDKAFAKILETGRELRDSALKALSSRYRDGSVTVLNAVPGVTRRELIEIEGNVKLVEADGLVGRVSGHSDLRNAVTATRTDAGCDLENAYLKVVVADGRITSLYDKEERRELLADTAGFTLYEDKTYDGEAWDIEQYNLEKPQHLQMSQCKIVSQGVRGVVDFELNFGQARGTVRMTLDSIKASERSNSMLRFDCHFEWHERRHLLKFEMPLGLFSDYATFDTGFGVQRRPTTRNTSWDNAKFEVAGHKFADYSEHGYGVAIVNDCKYGYAAQGNLFTLSLLRGPMSPDQEADQGPHDMSFGVLPHKGTYAESDVQTLAHAFNSPMRVVPALNVKFPFKVEGARNVLLETIKRGESDFDDVSYVENLKGDKTVVLRMHEHMGGHARAQLVIRGLPILRAELVNVLEDNVEELDVVTETDSETVDLAFRGFEIKTIKLTLA